MYKCGECGAEFEDFKEWHKDGGCYEADYGVYFEFDSHNYYPAVDWEGCPECGAGRDDCHELVECDRCNMFVDETWGTAFGNLCENCYSDLYE